jgi:hypothetical protein
MDRREPIERVYSRIQSLLGQLKLQPPAALVKLASITPLSLFVTTNYDGLLEAALAKARPGVKVDSIAYAGNEASDLPAIPGENSPPLVYHLFGKVSSIRNAYAVTEEDVVEFMCLLQSDGKRPKRLFDVLRDRHLLFLGCNFADWLGRFVVRTARGERLSDQRAGMQYVADRGMALEEGLVHFFKRFSRRTQLFAPSSPARFIHDLHAAWRKRVQPAAPEAAPVEPRPAPVTPAGSIFLSYAREDHAAVQKIRDRLANAGLQVWFDTKGLDGGDAYERIIRDHISRCSLFVPVISRSTQVPGSRFFRKEWRWALEKAEGFDDHDPFILPVNIDETSPSVERLPERFRQLQWTPLPGGETPDSVVEHFRSLLAASPVR